MATIAATGNPTTITTATTTTISPNPQIALTRLLTHLEATLSSLPQNSNANNNTPAHRSRLAANLEHARTLHLTSEKTFATNSRVSTTQREKGLEELSRQREWIRRLEGLLRGLEERGGEGEGDGGEDSSDEEEDDDDDEEDLLRVYEPARKAAFEGAGLDVSSGSGSGAGGGGESMEEKVQEAIQQQFQQQQHQQQQPELRSRKQTAPLSAKDNRSAASTSARETLFQNRSPQDQNQSSAADISKTETLMSHNRTEQEALTTGLLGLASALKQSSINFSSSLEAERDVVKRAEGGLDKSAQGMDAAGKRMGTLRRMSEGQGWWGRIKLYAFIFGLWVGCFLLVFVGPKLRF